MLPLCGGINKNNNKKKQQQNKKHVDGTYNVNHAREAHVLMSL
jgi:hypothetical protein